MAAAVIVDARGRVLIARRPARAHQGGRWEFPGGKLEAGETPPQALARELDEELGIQIQRPRPLIRLRHDYPERSVLLDVWRVAAWRGEAHGREGQPLRWVAPDELPGYRFPAANEPIVTAARLPDHYVITPEPQDRQVFLQRLEAVLAAGARLLQLRAPALPPAEYRDLAQQVLARVRAHGARLLLNAEPALLNEVAADGLHLPARRLLALEARPIGRELWLAASCHNQAELRQALKLGVDFAVLSPLRPTASHPGTAVLGWQGFASLVADLPLPVFALGGLSAADKNAAFIHGAQGVAGISAFWLLGG